jgi:hypothetical protein
MAFITHYRGHLHEYSGEFDESTLLHEVTLDEYLALQYWPDLIKNYPEQASADRENERREIQAATVPGDTLWLWRCVDESSNRTDGSWSEWAGLAMRRAGKVIRVWLVWSEQ